MFPDPVHPDGSAPRVSAWVGLSVTITVSPTPIRSGPELVIVTVQVPVWFWKTLAAVTVLLTAKL